MRVACVVLREDRIWCRGRSSPCGKWRWPGHCGGVGRWRQARQRTFDVEEKGVVPFRVEAGETCVEVKFYGALEYTVMLTLYCEPGAFLYHDRPTRLRMISGNQNAGANASQTYVY